MTTYKVTIEELTPSDNQHRAYDTKEIYSQTVEDGLDIRAVIGVVNNLHRPTENPNV